ncbi:hypothetical protein ACNOYE_09855 [Nannocystaceae bacterium ST9]
MQKLHFLAAMAVILGTTACPSIEDTLDDLSNLTDLGDEVDESTDGESSNDNADNNDNGTTDGSTDATTDATSTDTTDGACGSFGCDCVDSSTCDVGLECTDGTCQLPGADTTDTTTDTGGSDPWDPAACAEPSQVLMVGDLAGNFCSSPCAADADCPVAPAGTQGACALTTMQGADPSFCALICQPAMDSCPAGSTCKDLMDPMNPGLGLCTYP